MIPVIGIVGAAVVGSVIGEPIAQYIKDRFKTVQNGVTTITVTRPQTTSSLTYLIVGAGVTYLLMKAVKNA